MAKLGNALDNYTSDKPLLSDTIDTKLEGAPWARGGPSVRGWSKISSFMICQRMYFLESIKKMRPRTSARALDIGTLFHECMAAHYSTGGKHTFDPLHALKDDYPDIVFEVNRLLQAYFAKHAYEEAQTWDIRAVENEVVGHFPYKPPKAKKFREALVSCRHDLVVRIKPAGAPIAPPGPSPDGVWVVDHKVHRAITRDLVSGYGMDGQFLLMAYLWRNQGLDATLGKLNGFIINIITKTREVECKRLHINISDQDVDRYAARMTDVVGRLDQRVKAKDANDMETWPMNFASCKSPRGYGICKFWDFCLSHGTQEALYEIAPFKGAKPKDQSPSSK
jgi:hypothetical protein